MKFNVLFLLLLCNFLSYSMVPAGYEPFTFADWVPTESGVPVTGFLLYTLVDAANNESKLCCGQPSRKKLLDPTFSEKIELSRLSYFERFFGDYNNDLMTVKKNDDMINLKFKYSRAKYKDAATELAIRCLLQKADKRQNSPDREINLRFLGKKCTLWNVKNDFIVTDDFSKMHTRETSDKIIEYYAETKMNCDTFYSMYKSVENVYKIIWLK